MRHDPTQAIEARLRVGGFRVTHLLHGLGLLVVVNHVGVGVFQASADEVDTGVACREVCTYLGEDQSLFGLFECVKCVGVLAMIPMNKRSFHHLTCRTA